MFGWSLLSFLHGLLLHPESWVLVKCELGGQFAISSQSSQLAWMALSSISRACVASRVRGTHFSRGLSPLSPKAPMVHQCRLRFQPTWLGPARCGAMEGLSQRFQANGGVRPSPPEFTRNMEETKWTSHFSLLTIYKDSWTRAETSVTSLSRSSLYFSNDSCDQRQEVQHLLWWLPHRTFQNPGQSDQADGVSSAPQVLVLQPQHWSLATQTLPGPSGTPAWNVQNGEPEVATVRKATCQADRPALAHRPLGSELYVSLHTRVPTPAPPSLMGGFPSEP